MQQQSGRRYADNNQRPAKRQGSGQRAGYNTRPNETYKKIKRVTVICNRNKRSTGSRNANDRKNFDQQILEQKVAEKMILVTKEIGTE